GPRCVTHTWSRGMLRGAWEVPESGGTSRVRRADRFEASGRRIAIHQSSERSDGGKGSQLRCYDSWEVVRITDSFIEVMPGEDDKVLYSYHPDDGTRWFLKPEACETALKERPNYSLDDPRHGEFGSRVVAMNIGAIGC